MVWTSFFAGNIIIVIFVVVQTHCSGCGQSVSEAAMLVDSYKHGN